MSSSNQVAIITGGASGIGLAVAKAIASRGSWTIYILDKNEPKDFPAASFHQVDVTDYEALATAFASAFSKHKRLDFVFANAGVALEPVSSQQNGEVSPEGPPPAPATPILDINLRSVIYTTHLAQHYFKLSTVTPSVRSLVITASSAGFYASPIAPAYAASKHGVVGWTRSVAPGMWKEAGVRVNAICPGIVRTNILPDEMFQMFPESLLTSLTTVTEVVLMLMDGKSETDQPLVGQTLEICGTNHYFRDQIEYCDATMAAVMGASK